MNKFAFLVFASVLLNCTNARPDLSLGYRYNQGHSSGGGSILQAPNSITSSYSPTASGNSYFARQPSVGQIENSGFIPSAQLSKQEGFGGFSKQISSLGTGYTGISNFNTGITGNTQYNYNSGVQQSVQTPIVRKHFYVHTAPSDDDQEEVVRHIQIGQPQKNYHVVFIDSPSSHTAKAKIIADIAPTEEKTAIYVLSKKANALDISTEVNNSAPINNKPEIFYVKYKTPEEAIYAQRTIQAQYDALGGTSDVSNEGQVPVSSVIGTLDNSNAGAGDIDTSASTNGGSLVQATTQHTGINTQQTYLPSNRKFKLI